MTSPAQHKPINAPEAGYTLRLREGETYPDIALLRPDVLGALSIEKLNVKLGSAFEITGEAGSTLTLQNMPAVSGLGAHMASGRLIIQGSAGDDLGASMTGGQIHVQGDAGDRIGGPALEQYEDLMHELPDNCNAESNDESNAESNDICNESSKYNNKGGHARRGMNGGTIVVHGNAGQFAGLRMRRGMIVIKGITGHSPGYRMIAGTIVVAKGDLHQPGLQMQRGTIVSLSQQAVMHTQGRFAKDGLFEAKGLAVIGLLLSQLAKLGLEITTAMRQGQWQLASGDRLELGKGELWQWKH